MKTIIFDSSDPNGPFSRAVRNHLRLKGIKIINGHSSYKNVMVLRILTSENYSIINSIFQDNHTNKYCITMLVRAILEIPDNGIYPIKIEVYSSFFDDSYTVLIKETKKQLLIEEIYEKASEELVRKLLNTAIVNKNK